MIRRRFLLPVALLAALALAGCSTPIDNIVGGAVDRAVEEALGTGVDVTTDGQLPEGFPDIPLVDGTIVGGASGADAGWTVIVRPDSADRFAEAEQKLVDAGYTVTASNSDASSAFGSYSGSGYNVQLLFSTNADGEVSATYIVTNA